MLQTRERIPASQITVIYNGVPVSLAQEARIGNSHQSVPFDQGHKPLIIGNVGRLEPEKGHEDLLQAFARLTNESASPPQLWILGDGSLRDRLIGVTKELGIQNQVHFWGAQKTVAPFLDKMDIFILPSRWEGLSMALLEAMSHGIPVIATEVGGTPEVIHHGVHGLLIPAGNPVAITEAIEFLRNNPINRRQMGLQGKQHVIDNYTLERTVFSIDQLYKGLLS
jgi:glycosyltransferase involved in cell wall biosynthesis